MHSLTSWQIQYEILSYIHAEKGTFSSWYIGVTSNPHIRLFKEHNVELNNSWWVISKARNAKEGRLAEKMLIKVYGMDGGSGSGDDKSDYVYAYKKTETTIP